MTRLRQNFQHGTTTDNPLLIGGTTLNSAALASLVAVTGSDYLAITLDPAATNGTPEIIHVTAHTAAATSATITRGQEGSAAREHPVGTVWEHNITEDDFDYTNLDNKPTISTPSFVRNIRTSGNITVNGTTWANLDTGLDITLTGCVAGDWIEVGINGLWSNEGIDSYLDAVTVVAGSPVNSIGLNAAAPTGTTGAGTPGWRGFVSHYQPLQGSLIYQLVSGDISGGSVVLRLRTRTDTAGNKVMLASSTYALSFWARKG